MIFLGFSGAGGIMVNEFGDSVEFRDHCTPKD